MPTLYRILQEHEPNVWTQKGTPIEASSTDAAIRKCVAGDPPEGRVTLMAVPDRHFRATVIEVETVQRVKIVGAGDAAPAHPRAAEEGGE